MRHFMHGRNHAMEVHLNGKFHAAVIGVHCQQSRTLEYFCSGIDIDELPHAGKVKKAYLRNDVAYRMGPMVAPLVSMFAPCKSNL